jgi:hypothetical protein
MNEHIGHYAGNAAHEILQKLDRTPEEKRKLWEEIRSIVWYQMDRALSEYLLSRDGSARAI